MSGSRRLVMDMEETDIYNISKVLKVKEDREIIIARLEELTDISGGCSMCGVMAAIVGSYI